MHGMEMGTSGMHNQVRQWAREGFLASLFDLLLTNGFAVFLTSDHGNIEAIGCGRPNEGAIAEVRGERVRIYSDDILRGRVASRFVGRRVVGHQLVCRMTSCLCWHLIVGHSRLRE